MKKLIVLIALVLISANGLMADRIVESDYVTTATTAGNLTVGDVLMTTGNDLTWITLNDSVISNYWPHDPRYIHHYDSSLVRHRIECDSTVVKSYEYKGKHVEEHAPVCDTFFHWEKFPVYAPKVEVFLDSVQYEYLLLLIGEHKAHPTGIILD